MTPRRQGQGTLSRDRIVKTALRLVDEHGMEGHSMRDLAAALDVDVSTLYYHVPNKAALYDLVADAVMSDNDMSAIDATLPPAERFRMAAREFRATMLRHPNAIPLLIGKPLRSADQMRPVEVILGILFDAGFDSNKALLTLDAMAAYVLGCVAGQTGLESEPSTDEEIEKLAALPAEEFGNIHRILGEMDPSVLESYQDRMFEHGLDAMARGLFGEE